MAQILEQPQERVSSKEARSIHGQEGLGALFILLSACGFGVMGVFAVWSYRNGATTVTLLAMRFTIAAALLWPYLALTRQPLVVRDRRKLLGLTLLGAMYVGQALAYFNSIRYIPVGLTSIILFIHPAVVAVLAWLIFKEHMSLPKLLALGLALAGVALVIGAPTGTQTDLLLGIGIALIGVVVYSFYIILSTRIMVGISALTASAYVFTAAAIILLGYGLISGEFRPQGVQANGWDIPSNGWLDILGVALLGTVLAITTFFAGLTRLGPSRATIISTLEPIITALTGWLLLGQQLGPLQLLGGALILTAMLLLQARRRKVVPDA
jgi:drug/metabolite transporter (DMT)-like permease